MARSKEPLLIRMLRRGEDAGLLVSAATLMLVEMGYVAWLERLPALPSRAHPAGFLDLPPWHERPRVEVTLLLTVLGGMIAWAAWGVFGFMRSRPEGTVASSQRAMVYKRLRTVAFYAAVAGADLLVIQFLCT
jgi:uncharacterized iron-regulated membrane protein